MLDTTRTLALWLLVVAACGKGTSEPPAAGKGTSEPPAAGKVTEATPKPAFVPCDAASVAALAADLDKANCLGVDLSDKSITDACKATAKKVTGTTYAFKGCTFASQGNDVVSVGATGTDKTLDCHMKGGEAGVEDFREAAMKLDTDKLRLDVIGVIAKVGTSPIERLTMTDCEITAHE